MSRDTSRLDGPQEAATNCGVLAAVVKSMMERALRVELLCKHSFMHVS